MEVCEVCGAFLIIGDAQIRVDDHLQGKQHKGYAQIKAAVEEMKVRGVYLLGGGGEKEREGGTKLLEGGREEEGEGKQRLVGRGRKG